jgi:AcrR family transcriptional regulator
MILETAQGLLFENGIQGFTLLEVARRAGVPKSTVYRRWRSRRALLAAALENLATQGAQLPNTGTLRGDLVEAVEIQMAELNAEGRAFARIGLEAAGDDELGPIVRDALRRRRQAFFPVFQRAIARGELRPDIDLDAALDLVFGAVLSRMVSQRTDVEPGDAGKIVDRALRGLSHLSE